MATSACTFNGTCDYNGGWDPSYGTGGGYAHDTKCMVYKFTTGSFSGTYSNTSTSLTGTVTIRATGNNGGKGVTKLKIFTSDPRGGKFPDMSSGSTTTVSWSVKAGKWDTCNYTISTSSLKPSTTYYLVAVKSSGNNAELSGGGFSATVNYTYVNALGTPSKPSAPTNHHNNTFSASCSAVTSPTGNPTVTTLQYKLGSADWKDASNTEGTLAIARMKHTASDSTASQTVKVRVKANPEYGDTKYSPESDAITLKNYVPPALPSKAPSVTKTKTRFTIKEPWVVSWTGTGQTSTRVNSSSSIAGYRIVLKVKKAGESVWNSVPIKNSEGTTISKNPSTTTWHTIDTVDLGGQNSITIYPDKQEFAPGDQVVVGIRPYILWGAANPTHHNSSSNTNKLFNEAEGDYKYTSTITVQNAGVVRIKTGTDKSSFKEGIVWIKINNTGTKTTDWVEADVVKIKTGSGWKESE